MTVHKATHWPAPDAELVARGEKELEEPTGVFANKVGFNSLSMALPVYSVSHRDRDGRNMWSHLSELCFKEQLRSIGRWWRGSTSATGRPDGASNSVVLGHSEMVVLTSTIQECEIHTGTYQYGQSESL